MNERDERDELKQLEESVEQLSQITEMLVEQMNYLNRRLEGMLEYKPVVKRLSMTMERFQRSLSHQQIPSIFDGIPRSID